MKLFRRNLMLPMLVVFAVTSLLHADEVQCNLSVIGLSRLAKAERELVCVDGEGNRVLEIAASSSGIRPSIEYKGPASFQLFKKSEPNGAALATVKLRAGMEEAIVVLAPNKEEPGAYRAAVLNAGSKAFPKASRMFFNFTPRVLRGELGKMPFKRGGKENVRFVCEPTHRKMLPPILESSVKPLTNIPLILEYKQGSEWVEFIESRWFHQPNRRSLVFAYYDAGREKIMIKSISQNLGNPVALRNISANRSAASVKPVRYEKLSHPIYGELENDMP